MGTALPLARDLHTRFRVAVVAVSLIVAIGGSAFLATRDSGDGATTRGVAETLRLTDRPGSVAAGADALWLTLGDARRPVRDRPLIRLDLSSFTQRRFLVGGQASHVLHAGDTLFASAEHVGGEGSGPSIIVALDWSSGRLLARRQIDGVLGPLAPGAGDDLWALRLRPAALLHLDSRTLLQLSPPLRLPGGRSLGLATGAGYVWITRPDAGEVLRIDPDDRAIKRVSVGGTPAGILVAGGNAWFADREGGTVRRLDPKTVQPIGDPVHVSAEPSWLAQAEGFVFAGDAGSGTVARLAVTSGKRVGRPIRFAPPAKNAPAFALAPSGASVWVSSYGAGTVTRINPAAVAAAPPATTVSNAPLTSPVSASVPRGGTVIETIEVPPGGGAFAVGEGGVWAMSDRTSQLLHIDPVHNRVVARITIDPSGAAAAGAGAVWVSHPARNTVSRIDPDTDKEVATIPVGPHPDGIAVSAHAVWVANIGGPSVARIDPETNAVVATIKVGLPRECCVTEHMSVTAVGDMVYAAVPDGNKLVRIDARTNKVTGVASLPYCPGGFLGADGSSVWSAGGGCADLVARIDPQTMTMTVAKREAHPVGIAVAFGTAWAAMLASGDVDRRDPRTGSLVARLHLGGTPIRLAVGFGSVWINDDDGRVVRIRPEL